MSARHEKLTSCKKMTGGVDKGIMPTDFVKEIGVPIWAGLESAPGDIDALLTSKGALRMS